LPYNIIEIQSRPSAQARALTSLTQLEPLKH
jgi:hypothetical protein